MEIKFKEKSDKIKEVKLSNSTDTQVAICIAELMNASISLHKLHLKITGTGSYATHKALDVYGEFQDFADNLCEQYQSISETIIKIPTIKEVELSSVEECSIYLKDLKSKITNLQKTIDYSEINNLLDESKSKINKIRYRLIFLK